MTETVEKELWGKGILIVPDFVANAGGVISSYAEHAGLSPAKMFALVEKTISQTAAKVLKESVRQRRNPRDVALALAKEKVERAMAKKKHTFSE